MIYTAIAIPFIIGILIYIGFKNKRQRTMALKIGAFVFFVVFFFRLFSLDYFEQNNNANALLVIPNHFWRLLFILWRMITQGSVIVVLIAPFFKNKYYRFIMSYIVPVVAIVNLMLIKVNGQAFNGNFDWNNIRIIQFIWESALMFGLGILSLIILIKDKLKITKKELGKLVIIFFFVSISAMPLFTLNGLFGASRSTAKNFVLVHRIIIYLSIIIPAILYMIFRKKSYEDRYLLLVTLAVAGFLTYFNTYDFASFENLSRWPLHLCNTAILLMLIAFIFRSKTFFYFNYFINVIGALIAIVIPSTSGYLFEVHNMHFWVNHLYAFFLPILGVALHIFPRPNFKMILGSIGVFSIYFIVVAIVNSWFVNYDSGVNYFFLNDDFLAKKFSFLLKLRQSGIYELKYKDLVFKVYPWYWLGIYGGFIILTFATWFVYDALYKVSDHHYEWHIKKKHLKLLMSARDQLLEREEVSMSEIKSSIKIKNFSKVYGKNNEKAVDNFSLDVHAGEIFGFLGHNGAGKSTVIKSLVGIQAITEGSIEVCGFDVQKHPLQAKLMIGYVPDNHAVYERLTGREYIYYIADLFYVSNEDRKARLDKYIEIFDLTDAIDRQIKTYSHGMKQKITVIAALIHEPKVWVLDEPLTGLDPTSAFQIKECMKEHANAGNIVFFSSHIIEVVENICDRIAVIKKGKLVTVESINSIKDRGERLENIYLRHVEVGKNQGVKENVA